MMLVIAAALSSGGKGIRFTTMQHYWEVHPRVAVLELATRKCRLLLADGADARYVATDHVGVQIQPGFSVSKPQLLFDRAGYAPSIPLRS